MNRWRLACFVMALLAAVIFALYSREYARRIIAEIPSRIENAVVVLYPRGFLIIDREGMGSNVHVFTSRDVIVLPRYFPPEPRKDSVDSSPDEGRTL